MLAGCDGGAVLLLLRVAADRFDQAGSEHGVDERARHQRPAELLKQHAEVEEGEAFAAEVLGGHQAHPTLLGHAVPEVVGVAALVLFHIADELLGAFVGQEVTSEILEQFLLFGQSQVHGFLSVADRSSAPCVPLGSAAHNCSARWRATLLRLSDGWIARQIRDRERTAAEPAGVPAALRTQ